MASAHVARPQDSCAAGAACFQLTNRKGLIQHGFATGVDAEYIGAGVWINQQVTIGSAVDREGKVRVPRIEDGATIYAGIER